MSNHLEQLFSLKGRVAVVTSADRGFGAAIVRGLAQTGAITCGTGNPAMPEWQPIKDELYIRSNINNPMTFKFLCQELYEKYGKLSILINAAEVSFPLRDSQIKDGNRTSWSQTIETNLETTFSTSKIAAKYIRQSGGGSIINIISIKSLASPRDKMSYVAFKDELLIMAKKMAASLIKDNVHVNNIVLGYPPKKKNHSQNAIAKININNEWQDLIRATVFLASKGSSCITGQGIFILCDEKLASIAS